MSNDDRCAEGIVAAVKNGFVTVRLSSAGCPSSRCRCCAGSLEIRIKTEETLSVGDKVAVCGREGDFLKHAALFYGVPTAFMAAAAFFFDFVLAFTEIWTAVCSLFSAAPAWLLVKKLSRKEKYPRVIKRAA